MQFFSRKKDQAKPISPPRTDYLIQLSDTAANHLPECNATLKIWLPESIEKKVDQMCSYVNTSASDLIRQILFIHLYGRYDLFGVMERQRTTFNLSEPPMFSLSSDDIKRPDSQAEKNVADVKVWIPSRLKVDLNKLALKSRMSMSNYAREVIITHLLGHVDLDDNLLSEEPPDGVMEE